MKNAVYALSLAFVGLVLSACASGRKDYDAVKAGAFHGSVDLRWVAPDKFVLIPNESDPFYFERANGEVIKPGLMYTDGGTIPRLLWNNPNYSPWGYAPAYLIHDWIFYQSKEALSEEEVEEAADVLAEGIKTLMEAENGIPSKPRVLRNIRRATSSGVALKAGEITPWYDYLPDPGTAIQLGSAFFQGPEATIPTPAAVLDDEIMTEDSFTFNPNDDIAERDPDPTPDSGRIDLRKLFGIKPIIEKMERPETKARREKLKKKAQEN